ncbi:MAG: hypothetical protein WC744_02735 [Patescibacteria group bacterium]|jgi:hypothetical protein
MSTGFPFIHTQIFIKKSGLRSIDQNDYNLGLSVGEMLRFFVGILVMEMEDEVGKSKLVGSVVGATGVIVFFLLEKNEK